MSRTVLFLLVAVAVLTVKTTAKSNDNNNDDDNSKDKNKYWLYELLINLFDIQVQRDPMPEWVDKGWKACECYTHYLFLTST